MQKLMAKEEENVPDVCQLESADFLNKERKKKKKAHSWTIKICNNYELHINKTFIPVKMSLFFWFAGAMTTSTFLPVILKHQGLTVAHLSVFIAFAVFIQFLSSLVSGVIADKIGRAKPILFTYYTAILVIIFIFTLLPKVKECNTKVALNFTCQDIDMLHYTTTTACRNFQNDTDEVSCVLTDHENGDYQSNCSYFNNVTETSIKIEKIKVINDSEECLYDVQMNNDLIKTSSLCHCRSFESYCGSDDSSDCNTNRAFWIVIYGIIYGLLDVTRSTTFRLLDVIVVDLTTEHDSDFGRQRVFSMLGTICGPLLTGFILQITASDVAEKNYMLAYVCSAVFIVLSALCMWKVDAKLHRPATKMWKKSMQLIKKLEVVLYILLLIVMGNAFCFQTAFSSWYLQDIGASDFLIGFYRGIAGLYSLPFLYTSKWWIKKIGVRNLFLLGLLAYTVFCFSFSVMDNPWYVLILQSLTIFTYHLFVVSMMQYSVEISLEGLQATVKVLSGAIHYNIGKLVSSVFGGYIMNTFGGRTAYKVLACFTLVYAAIYGSYLCIRHFSKNKKSHQRGSSKRGTNT